MTLHIEDFNRVQRVAGVGWWKYDVLKDKLYVSDEIYRIFGVDAGDFKNDFANSIKLIHPEDQTKLIYAMEKHLLGEPFETEFRIPQRDSSQKFVKAKGEPLYDNYGQVIGALGVLKDLTERKNMEKALRKSNKALAKTESLAHIGSWELDMINFVSYWSDETYKIYGIGREQFDNTFEGYLKYVYPEDINRIRDLYANPPFGQKDIELRIIRSDGEVRDVYERLEFIFDKDNRPIYVYGSIQDITERKRLEKKIEYISTHDDLTGLPNKLYFDKKIRNQCKFVKRNKRKFSLMMLDIDGLEYIKLSLGYELADKLIIEIVNRIKLLLGKDQFLSRYSDDHYAILLSNVKTHEECEDIANRILHMFVKSFKIENFELDVSANIGILMCDGDIQDPDILLKQVKVALLRAKREKKNTYKFYSTDLKILNDKEAIIRNDLHYAIKRDEFRVYYQPIVNLRNNEILGAEALIRWVHPAFGMLYPNEFIPMAEETGLIIDIGKWVLREACKDYKAWISKGLPEIYVSVNFSGIQFLENNFVENIKEIIDEYGLDYSFLTLEITENILLTNTNKVVSDLKSLRTLGIRVAVDDFGTGYSSLAMLSAYEIDVLKIDRSFVVNAPIDSRSAAVTNHTINLAKDLNIDLVAEGIETWDQLSYLIDTSCHNGQGYLYSKPLPLEEFELILNQNNFT
ncbi:MAG: EAL domain-containing protein [Tissierellaceae bacterium]|nr:EAL domain-containing protein [Tissierellaceae bacterium]